MNSDDIKWGDIQRMLGILKGFLPSSSLLRFLGSEKRDFEEACKGMKIHHIHGGILLQLKTSSEVIDKIMENGLIEGLRMNDCVKILLLSLASRDMTCLHETDCDEKTNRKVMLKRVEKCLKMLKNTKEINETILHAFAFSRYAYYSQWKDGDISEKKKICRGMLVRSHSLLLKKYPQILSMGPFEYANIPSLKGRGAILSILKGRCQYLIEASEQKTLHHDEIKKDVVGICDLFERLLTSYEFIDQCLHFLLRQAFPVFLEDAASCFEHLGEMKKSLEYRKKADGVRSSVFDFVEYINQRKIFSSTHNAEDLVVKGCIEVYINRITLLTNLGRFDDTRILIESISSRKDLLDPWMLVLFERYKSYYFKEIGDYVQYFKTLNKCIELHIQTYGWTKIQTHDAVMDRISILLLVGEKEETKKDIKRMSKLSYLLSKEMRGKLKEFEKVASQSGLYFKIPVDLKSKLLVLKEYLNSKKKKDEKDLGYQKNRICSNDICSISETHTMFKVCGICKTACYCSRKCQKKHWKHHKRKCRKDLGYHNNRTCSSEKCSKLENSKRRFMLCGICKVAVYCSTSCQEDHWEYHKMECKNWKKKRK